MQCPFCGAEMREGYVEVYRGRLWAGGAALLAFHDADDRNLPAFRQLEKQVPLIEVSHGCKDWAKEWYTLPASRCGACKKTILHGA